MEGLSAKELGSRLRSARETAGLSTRIVARQLSERGIPVSHATVANYETGISFPSMPAVRTMAALYNRPVEWFLAAAETLTGVRYRSLKSVRAAERQAFEGTVAAWTQVYVELENVLGQPLATRPCEVGPDDTGPGVAAKVRADFKLDDNPVPSVVELLEGYGVHVIQVHSDARIDGLAGMYGGVRVVALNDTLANDRFRFNAGHELGHHLFGDCREGEPAAGADEDPRAHEFASHLLMPDAVLAQAFESKSMVRLVQFKERYGISLAAMIYRARYSTPSLITEELYQRLWREFGKLGWRKQEPGYVRPDRPTRLEQLIETAVEGRKLMSYADVARIGGLNEAAVRSAVARAKGGGDVSLGEGES